MSHEGSGQDSVLRDVAVAVATFRSQPAALGVLRGLFDERGEHPYHSVILVDSLGDGSIPAEAESRGWKRFVHFSSSTNLGSAGNLAKRVELAHEVGARWAYAVNHDGQVRREVVRALAARGEQSPRIGAVYPLRYRSRIDRWDYSGITPWPTPAIRLRARPRAGDHEVFWASSNGALYATAPLSDGIGIWGDLWMGYEDMGYGWELHRRGWRQILCADVVFEDSYEYDDTTLVPVVLKPAWYSYYGSRNLFLITRRAGRGPLTWAVLAGRLAIEAAVIAAFRDHKRERAGLMVRGILDGLRGRAGHAGFP